jgi:hypothetical protein
MLNRSARDNCEPRAYFACPIRVMRTISMSSKTARAEIRLVYTAASPRAILRLVGSAMQAPLPPDHKVHRRSCRRSVVRRPCSRRLRIYFYNLQWWYVSLLFGWWHIEVNHALAPSVTCRRTSIELRATLQDYWQATELEASYEPDLPLFQLHLTKVAVCP